MGGFWLVAHLLLWGTALGVAFLLVGALRSLAVRTWRQEQLEVALSGRLGLPPGTRAPAFALPSVQGARVTLKSFAGRRVLLVFTQISGHRWQQLLPELNRLQQGGSVQVLLIETGGPEAAKQLAVEGQAAFPVLAQETRNLARRYHVHALPFAFLIDEQGTISARGTATNRQHLDFLLTDATREPAATVARLQSPIEKFVPRPDDIFVVTYPRSGTTWMQMILYQLTTAGNMDFPHITTVCPWFERSLKDGTAYDALPAPRVFKSHLSYGKIPKGPCKYIYVARDGKDVAVSYYHFCQTHMGFQGSFDEFFERFLKGEVPFGSWFRHVRGWYAHRGDPNVLFLRYEELAADLPGSLRRIAAFCGLEVDPGRWPGILERCSFAFMKQHESQFDPLTAMLYERGFRANSHLRQGQAGAWTGQLSPRQARRFDKTFIRRLGGTGIEFQAVSERRVGCQPAGTEGRLATYPTASATACSAPAPPSSGGAEPCYAVTTPSGLRVEPSP
jgi:methylamine dehydrogenase accessory protein MauD